MTRTITDQKVDFCKHLGDVAAALSAAFREQGIGVEVDASDAIQAVNGGADIQRVRRFDDPNDRSGVLHVEQIRTAAKAMRNLIEHPDAPGLIVGAMQSGKTTTSLALSFLGPTCYVVNGTKLFPIYLTTSQNNHEAQATAEFEAFLSYYQDLKFRFDARSCSLREIRTGVVLAEAFAMSPTLKTYRDEVLREARAMPWKPPTLEELVKRRVQGKVLRDTVDLCQRMHAGGFVPLFIIDEPQWGAGNRPARGEAAPSVKDCVLLQLFKGLRAAIPEMGANEFPRFVGMSATPYELIGLSNVWKVYQDLGQTYRGFNWINGQRIDPAATIEPPEMRSLGEMAADLSIPFVANLHLDVYSNPRRFKTWAKHAKFRGTHADYRGRFEKALRALVLRLVEIGREETGGPVGVCIRGLNNNTAMDGLLARLALPVDVVDRRSWFGEDGRGHTVRDVVRALRSSGRSFVIAVTSKARMGDAFPSQVRYFIDLTRKASTQNALLQGLLGRACGYNKDTLVVMSAENTTLARRVANGEKFVLPPSANTVRVGDSVASRPITQVVIRRGIDPIVDATFFMDMDRHVLAPLVVDGPGRKLKKAGKGGRRGAIYQQPGFSELLRACADKERRSDLVGSTDTPVFALPDDEHPEGDASTTSTVEMRFIKDELGHVRFTFRSMDQVNRGGSRGRGRGQRDGSGPSGNVLEPQVGIEKVDAEGRVVDDADEHGTWRVGAVSFPLRAAIRVGGNVEVLPNEQCVYDQLMTDEERKRRAG